MALNHCLYLVRPVGLWLIGAREPTRIPPQQSNVPTAAPRSPRNAHLHGVMVASRSVLGDRLMRRCVLLSIGGATENILGAKS